MAQGFDLPIHRLNTTRAPITKIGMSSQFRHRSSGNGRRVIAPGSEPDSGTPSRPSPNHGTDVSPVQYPMCVQWPSRATLIARPSLISFERGHDLYASEDVGYSRAPARSFAGVAVGTRENLLMVMQCLDITRGHHRFSMSVARVAVA